MKPNHNINEYPNPYFFTLAEVHQLREILKVQLNEAEVHVQSRLGDVSYYKNNFTCVESRKYIKKSYAEITKTKQKIKSYAKLQTKLKHSLVTAG